MAAKRKTKQDPGRVTVRMPADLAARIARYARADGRTISQAIRRMLEAGLGEMEARR